MTDRVDDSGCPDLLLASQFSSFKSTHPPPDLLVSPESWLLLLKKFVTGASALIRNDLASSVLAERSLFDLGLDGGLGGFSVVMDISSADDASTLVLDDPALILPLVSRTDDSDSRLRLRLGPGSSARSSLSSLLEEFAEVDRLLSLLELDVPDGLFFVPQGDFEPLLDPSSLVEPLGSFLPVVGFAPAGPLSLARPDFNEAEEPEEAFRGPCSAVGSESWELTETVRWLFFLLAYLDCDGSPFSMFKVDLRKSLFTYFAATMQVFGVAAVVVSFFGTGGLPRASGEPPRRRFTDDGTAAPPVDLPDDGGVVGFIFTP